MCADIVKPYICTAGGKQLGHRLRRAIDGGYVMHGRKIDNQVGGKILEIASIDISFCVDRWHVDFASSGASLSKKLGIDVGADDGLYCPIPEQLALNPAIPATKHEGLVKRTILSQNVSDQSMESSPEIRKFVRF